MSKKNTQICLCIPQKNNWNPKHERVDVFCREHFLCDQCALRYHALLNTLCKSTFLSDTVKISVIDKEFELRK